MTPGTGTGLFDRVISLLDIVDRFPDDFSDEETEGLVHLLPGDVAHAVDALFIPRLRRASIVFMKMISKWMHDALRAPSEEKKTILVPFNFPPELIHAFERARPITSEVLSTLSLVALEGQGERYWDLAMGLGLPDYICSSNTIELGSMLGGEDFKAQAIVSAAPGGCDVNAKIHEFVANYLGIPQLILEKPPDDSGRGRELYGRYYRALVSQLEEFVGEDLVEERLRAVVERANRCTELYHELWEMRKAVPCPVPNLFSLFTYGTRFTMWGTDEGVKTLEVMVDMARKRLKEGAYPAERELARSVWVYTSYYFDFAGFWNWMEERGYTHLGDLLHCFFPEPIDTTSRESMIDGMAGAAWNMPMTRTVGGQMMFGTWLEDSLHACRELDANSAVFCGHHSCKQTWSVVSIIREELRRRAGIPLLSLQGDAWVRRMTPMEVIQRELDDFMTTVVARGRRRKVRRQPGGATAGRTRDVSSDGRRNGD